MVDVWVWVQKLGGIPSCESEQEKDVDAWPGSAIIVVLWQLSIEIQYIEETALAAK